MFINDPRLEAWLAEALGAREVSVERAEKLSGGAIQENWRVDLRVDGEFRRFVLRRNSEGTIESSRTRKEEHAIVAAAWKAGVAVPQPVAFCEDDGVEGQPFAVLEHVGGVGYGPKIVRDAALGGNRAALGRELGRQLARIHAIEPDPALASVLGPPPANPAAAEVKRLRDGLDAMGDVRPGLEWALRWAERFAPAPDRISLTHQDFRTGNFLVDEAGLTAILDWEFAGWSDPMSDVGWFCAECWRFSRPDLHGGGICDRKDFYAAYQEESGFEIDPARVRWWEVVAHVRWAVIALQQGRRRASGLERLNLALTGRIADPVELMALRMTAPESVPA